MRGNPYSSLMNPVLTSIARLFSLPGTAPAVDPVRRLLEQAAGRGPDQAHELRQAAAAWLRVIR
jgi:hypothetical protein